MGFSNYLSETFFVVRAKRRIERNSALACIGPDDRPERSNLVDAEQKLVGRFGKMIAAEASARCRYVDQFRRVCLLKGGEDCDQRRGGSCGCAPTATFSLAKRSHTRTPSGRGRKALLDGGEQGFPFRCSSGEAGVV